jgi:hypothetical protein
MWFLFQIGIMTLIIGSNGAPWWSVLLLGVRVQGVG